MTFRAPFWVGAICLFSWAAAGANDPQVSIAVRSRAPVAHADFHTESDLVLIPVSVTDEKNHAVVGLDRSAFHIFDDKAEQSVVQFACEDAPLSVGIVFDSSQSMDGKLQKSREAIHQFLRFANPEDEFFLVEFSTRARLTVPFTDDAGEIQNRLLHAAPSGRTALLDATGLAMDYLRRHARYPRRALLILSDGGDNHSRYSETEILNRVRESNLWIYAMGIYDRAPGSRPSGATPGRQLLHALAEASGGRQLAVDSLIDLPVAAASISLELRNQYVLGYRPTTPRRDGRYHHVQVNVTEGRNLTVSWRPGYYGPVE